MLELPATSTLPPPSINSVIVKTLSCPPNSEENQIETENVQGKKTYQILMEKI